MTTLYGIPNCDTVKKTRRWLDGEGVIYDFHDLRADGLARERAASWIDALGWEQVVNRRSTSWRALDAAQRGRMDAEAALAAILETPTLVRRPVLEHDGTLRIGFDAKAYAALFGRG